MPPPTKITENEPGEQQPAALVDPTNGATVQPSAQTRPRCRQRLLRRPRCRRRLRRPSPRRRPVRRARPRSPRRSLGAAAGSDRCAACGAHLANDQRYCLECGERRGQARFTAPAAATAATSSSAGATAGTRPAGCLVIRSDVDRGDRDAAAGARGRRPDRHARGIHHRRRRLLEGAGRDRRWRRRIRGGGRHDRGQRGDHQRPRARAPAAAPAAATRPRRRAPSRRLSSNSGGSSSGGVKTIKAAPPPTVTVGLKGADNSAGCQGGKFTGNFFGGGG